MEKASEKMYIYICVYIYICIYIYMSTNVIFSADGTLTSLDIDFKYMTSNL